MSFSSPCALGLRFLLLPMTPNAPIPTAAFFMYNLAETTWPLATVTSCS
ncbi:MAG: hypothetical protein IPP83_12570 [Flavobacteriales bacterium]|nr:hypothetical protein [Flavobacteriales bacterium]